MRSQPLLLLAPLSALLLGGLGHASGGPVEWNRRAVQVAGVAQPDGSTMLHAAVQTQLFTPSSTPRDLSMDVEFRINGVPVGGELEYVDGGTLAHALTGRLVIS